MYIELYMNLCYEIIKWYTFLCMGIEVLGQCAAKESHVYGDVFGCILFMYALSAAWIELSIVCDNYPAWCFEFEPRYTTNYVS